MRKAWFTQHEKIMVFILGVTISCCHRNNTKDRKAKCNPILKSQVA